MLPEPVIRLIRDEQARQQGRFIQNVDLEAYLAKLATRAEVVSHCVGDRCRGVVAFYGNDLASRQAYITLLVVDPVERGLGLGGALLHFVLQTARRRGFDVCRLEVSKDNSAALQFYRNHGFAPVADRGASLLLETKLI